jgi:tetratricopeptide (TPR) repeat protein
LVAHGVVVGGILVTAESLIASRGLEAAVAEYRKTVDGSERYNVAEDELNALGYRYLQSGRTAEAVTVFQINAQTFPLSWNVWDSLAEAHLAREEEDRAEEFYRKSVKLNPDNQNAKSQLSIIRGNRLELAGRDQENPQFRCRSPDGAPGALFGAEAARLATRDLRPGDRLIRKGSRVRRHLQP